MMPLWLRDLGAMFVPRVCKVCGRALVEGEDIMCLTCTLEMPRVEADAMADNELTARCASAKVRIVRGAGYYWYIRDNPYARLIHKAKYDSQPRLGRALARRMAAELQPRGFFDGIDAITPVPLHPSKLASRGYNQSLHIARGVADIAGLPVEQLLAARRHGTQTRLGSLGRWRNTAGVYVADCQPRALAGRHILIVDDILTTGSTILHCAEALAALTPDVRASFLTLGVTALQ